MGEAPGDRMDLVPGPVVDLEAALAVDEEGEVVEAGAIETVAAQEEAEARGRVAGEASWPRHGTIPP
ncbi:MAG TPA: hypothetical protein VMR66_03750 [Gemmatimonadota bacterium]|nr:hypothetical protein [Gemmatimonadota bacterium]